jgi:hypothetical protein
MNILLLLLKRFSIRADQVPSSRINRSQIVGYRILPVSWCLWPIPANAAATATPIWPAVV